MKYINKLMVSLLCCTLLFGAMLTSGVTSVKANESSEEKYKAVFSIDAGRKYFSQAQLEQIIDNAYKNGYTDVQILLGNDALRFFLDDMSVTLNGKTYSSDAVKAGLTAGNKKYYDDPNGNALTQTEMNAIIAYAKERGLNVIPVINSPGHMDAILEGMEQIGLQNVRYEFNNKKSERTVNIENKEATDFVNALVKKYITYFGNTGACEIFNFGADEFANDVFTSPGWKNLQDLGIYDKFVEYTNTMSAMIKEAGMLPMCFNDGIYYNKVDTAGTFDKDIIISYWTAGWWEFYVAKPEYLVEKGHKILNTNDRWYWVLGNVTEGGYKYPDTLTNIENLAFTDVTGAKGDVPIIGSMQCVWSDEPRKEHDMERILNLQNVFSAKHSTNLRSPKAIYTSVEEALASIPADLTIFTEESVATLVNAKNAVVLGLEMVKQTDVDAMAKAINDAIAGLVVKEVVETPVTPQPPKEEVKKPVENTNKAPNTGDTTNQTGLLFVLLLSGAVAAYATQRKIVKTK